MTDLTGEGPREITFEEATARGDFIQLESRPAGSEDAPLAGFNPDDALERMRELAGSEDNANEVVSLFAKLDHWLIVGGRLPAEWAHPEPGVIAERVMRNQPRRMSRKERR